MIDVDALKMLKDANLRPTKQRVSLVNNIYKYGNRHVNAEILHKEILDTGDNVSLATVYNTLHHLTNLGFLRQVKINARQNYFDTNIIEDVIFQIQAINKKIPILIKSTLRIIASAAATS